MNEQALLAAIGAMLDEKLEPVKADITGLKADITGLKADITGIKADITEVRADITGIKADITGIKDRLGKVEERTTKLEITIENQVDRMIKLLGEGHESLRQTIEERLATKEQQEESDIRTFALEEAAKKHTVQIEELQEKIG